jgi:hypothetical protein
MSVLISSTEQIVRSCVNNSQSKQMYSIPVNKRFTVKPGHDNPRHQYNIPSTFAAC